MSQYTIKDSAGREVFHFNSSNAALYIGANGNEGDIIVRDGSGREVFHFNAAAAALYIGATGNEGDIIVRDGQGRDVFHFNSEHAAVYIGANGNEGDVIVRDGTGAARIWPNRDWRPSYDLADSGSRHEGAGLCHVLWCSPWKGAGTAPVRTVNDTGFGDAELEERVQDGHP